jgi:hypothetical protein
VRRFSFHKEFFPVFRAFFDVKGIIRLFYSGVVALAEFTVDIPEFSGYASLETAGNKARCILLRKYDKWPALRKS